MVRINTRIHALTSEPLKNKNLQDLENIEMRIRSLAKDIFPELKKLKYPIFDLSEHVNHLKCHPKQFKNVCFCKKK